MKKIYIITALALMNFMSTAWAQLSFVKAPNFSGSTTQLRAPNGTSMHAVLRGCFLITASELSAASGQTFQTFGFNLTVQSPSVACPGTITIYFQNTSDATYLKGTTWANIPTGMTNVYNGSMTVPAGTGSAVITLSLSTPFAYTGTGLYVAYEWISNGPYETSTIVATYEANNSLNPGGATAQSSVVASPPANLSNTSFRPCFNFGYVNTLTNEAQVLGIIAPGKISMMHNAPYTFSAVIKNNAGAMMTNIVPTLQIIGPSSYTTSANISVIAPGASHTLGFPAYTPTAVGLHTVQVLLPADQNTLNNQAMVMSSVTCNEISNNPPVGSYTSQSVGSGTNSIILCTKMKTTVASTLAGIQIAISTNTASGGNQVYGVLMNNTGSIVATTQSVFLNPSMYGTFQTFTFATGQPINPNMDYFIGMAQTQNTTLAYYPFGTQASTFNPGQYYTAPITGNTINPLTTNFGYFGIEAIMSGTCTTVDIPSMTDLNTTLSLYPNPVKDMIQFKGLKDNARIEVFDIQGRKIMENKILVSQPQSHLDPLKPGIYMIRITEDSGRSSDFKVFKE